MTVFNVIFEPLGRKVQCPDSTSILDCARQAGVGINSVCGGMGTCHTCKVRLVSGSASDISESEEEAYTPAELKKGWRLACQVYPKTDCKFEIPSESMTLLQRLQVEGAEIPVAVDPPVKSYNIIVSAPTLSDLEADADRTMRSLREQHNVSCDRFDISVLRDLSEKQRRLKGQFQVAVRDSEIIGVSAKETKLLGLAVDVGSTKIAVYILDLETGKTLGAEGIMNPQVDYGDDIVSRMTNAIKTPGVRTILQQFVVQSINDTMHKLCDSIKVSQEQIVEAVIVGNTAMHHFLLGLPVHQLAIAPYIPAVSMPLDIKARDIGISIAGGAYVHLLPNIAGFVGADHVAALLGVEALKIDVPAVVLDIGTNTEISLINKGKITSVSCASGPAFEGAHIKSGMRAANGAIERVQILGDKIKYQTVGNSPAIGVCGSGLLDVVAQFYLSGIIDKTGRLKKDHPRVSLKDGVSEFLLVEGSETGNGQPIVISQRDIRELQLAKAAIRSGIEVILKKNDMKHESIEKVIIAGAFGTYINVESAVAIGMLPPLPRERFSQVGNAAGTGARLALLSSARRAEEKELLKRVNYVELAGSPDFMKIYMESNYIGRYRFSNNHREDID